jgi:SAM-dependent MidA family methyltransferase
MKSVLSAGELLLLDYGYEQADYYHPARTTGTIRTYGKHQAGEDPLVDLGAIDITAHVDFTALMEDGLQAGFAVRPLQNQGSFLTRAGKNWLLAQEGRVDADMIRQFQTLTHPAQLGTKFWVSIMELNN